MFKRIFLVLLSIALNIPTNAAQQGSNSLTFGSQNTVSTLAQGSTDWQAGGEGHVPYIVIDKVILTPKAPPSLTGVIWAKSSISEDSFTADVYFSVYGPDQGGGNINIWLVDSTNTNVSSPNPKLFSPFRGVLLSIDRTYQRNGRLHGFLNDGTITFADHPSVDSLAFGQCDFHYRQLGRPIRVRIFSSPGNFKVEVDNHNCLNSDKITLPKGYFFGISASSADPADSFELNNFAITMDSSSPRLSNPERSNSDSQQGNNREEQSGKLDELRARLDDITAKMKSLSDDNQRVLNTIAEKLKIPSDRPTDIYGNRFDSMEKILGRMQSGNKGDDYQKQFSTLQGALDGLASGITSKLDKVSSVSTRQVIVSIVAVLGTQGTLFLAYLVYNSRKNAGAKKFL